MGKDNNSFTFEISLSILNHLGRNLYRSFATVLGEAISNSWDADAKNVYIYVDRERNSFFIKDDGIGMDFGDFQKKFLKIGYSKRKSGEMLSPGKRPYIGRKGIGKLALLSCAERITAISKKKDGEYVGGTIDNSGLSKAITDDLKPSEYELGTWNPDSFAKHVEGHEQGTIILFEGIHGGITNSLEFLMKTIALCFRFSLLDENFNIYLNDEKVTPNCLKDLADTTEFVWIINENKDPFVFSENLKNLKELRKLKTGLDISGFIASVAKPRDLKITGIDERVGVDLFVNGRIREKNILKYIPTNRLAESYLYGQIHYNALDTIDIDRFTSSREGVVADDPEYLKFQEALKKLLLTIVDDWDSLRIKNREDGDSENEKNMPKKERKSAELYNAVSEEYSSGGKRGKETSKDDVDSWVDELSSDAKFNFLSYAECFISENLIRKYIRNKKIPLTKEALTESEKWQNREKESKERGNVSIGVRQIHDELSYLSMDDLANLVDKVTDPKTAGLSRDANEYKPMRDALAHTALLSELAKSRLTSVYENIKGRLKTLFTK